METIDNPMLKAGLAPDYRDAPYQPPCNQTALTFREWLLETFTLEELIDYAEIRLAAMKRLGPRYQAEMREEGCRDIEEVMG